MLLFPFSLFDSWNYESWLPEKQHILDTDSQHIQPFGEPSTSSAKYCHLAGTMIKSSKSHSTILSSQVFQDGGEHGKVSEFHEHGPTPALLLLYGVSFLFRSNDMCNTMMADKVLYHSMGYSFDRNIACRKDKYSYP